MSLATGIAPSEILADDFDLWTDLQEEIARRWTPYDFATATVQILHSIYRAYLASHGAKPKDIPDPIEIPPQGDPPPPVRVGIREFAALTGRPIEGARRGG